MNQVLGVLLTIVAAVHWSISPSSGATTTAASSTVWSSSSSTDETTWSSSTKFTSFGSSPSSTDFTSDSTANSTDDTAPPVANSTEYSTDVTGTSSITTQTSGSTDNSTWSSTTLNSSSETSTCWWCGSSWSSWYYSSSTDVTDSGIDVLIGKLPGETTVTTIGTTTDKEEEDNDSDSDTDESQLSFAVVGGIVAGCTVVVSLVAIIIALKLFGTSSGVGAATVVISPGASGYNSAQAGWAQSTHRNPNYVNFSSPQYTYHGQQQQSVSSKGHTTMVDMERY